MYLSATEGQQAVLASKKGDGWDYCLWDW